MTAAWPRRDTKLLLIAIAWLAATIGLRPLTLPDEGRYVGVAWEMLASGNWLYPTLDGLPFFHKPPLFYWITASGIGLFGRHLWAARLAPLVAAVIIVVLLHGFVKRQLGAREARWTLLVLVTTPLFFGSAQFASLDLLVAAFISATILLAAEVVLDVAAGRPYRPRLVAAYLCAALGVLAKGLIGAVLPGLVLLAWLAVRRSLAPVRTLFWWPGVLLFAAVTLPWFLAVQARFPGFLHYFFVYHHFQRYVGSGFNNPLPFWFYLPVLLVGFLPWAWLLLLAVRDGWRARTGSAIQSLMWTWAAVVVAFFSVPQSKLVGYVLPAVPPLAVLAALAAVRRYGTAVALPGPLRWSAAAGGVVCLAIVLGMTAFDTGNNRALGAEIAARRQPGEPVVFVGRQFFDLPFYLGLRQPVPIAALWDAARASDRDGWHKTLLEAASFDPGTGDRFLILPGQVLPHICDAAAAWIIAKPGDAAELAGWLAPEPTLDGSSADAWRVTSEALRRQGRCPQTPTRG